MIRNVLAALIISVGWVSLASAQDMLLDSLDLSRPELATVRNTYTKHDLPQAKHLLADYYRARTDVHWEPNPMPENGSYEYSKKAADDAVNHTFTVSNIAYTFPADTAIDWKFNPTAQPDSKNALNHEWTWQFNRMYFWPALARAYQTTGDKKYARELTAEITSWIAANPMPTTMQNVPFSRWRTIEAGIRMFETWPEVFFRLVKDRDAFPDDVLLAMVDSMRQHAEYLDLYPTSGNWKAMESNGLFHVGVLFPEYKSAAKWRDDGIDRQHKELSIQVYPDGTQRELAPGYHNVALKNFLGTLDLARLNRIKMPADYVDLMEKMFDVNLYLCLPDHTYANFNDSGRGPVAEMLKQGLRIFPQRQDWRWIVTNGKEGKRPEKTSYFFPQAGWHVMRSSWDRDALCLIMDAGPFGTGHQHEDKLSFILDAYGSHLVAEAGIYTYDASAMRTYSLGPAAHNTVFIDGMGENRRGGPRSVRVADPTLPVKWVTNDQFDYSEATFGHHEGERWGKDRVAGFIHTRRILFVKPMYFIVIDTITPPAGDKAEHQCEAIFHLDATDARIDETSRAVSTTDTNRSSLTILPFGETSMRIVKGQTSPEMQGWISDHLYDMRAVPTAIYSKKNAGEVRLMYVFAPARAGEKCCVKSVDSDGVLKLRDGHSARVALSDNGIVEFYRDGKKEFTSAQ